MMESLFSNEFYNNFLSSCEYFDEAELKHFINTLGTNNSNSDTSITLPIKENYSDDKSKLNYLLLDFHNQAIKVT